MLLLPPLFHRGEYEYSWGQGQGGTGRGQAGTGDRVVPCYLDSNDLQETKIYVLAREKDPISDINQEIKHV